MHTDDTYREEKSDGSKPISKKTLTLSLTLITDYQVCTYVRVSYYHDTKNDPYLRTSNPCDSFYLVCKSKMNLTHIYQNKFINLLTMQKSFFLNETSNVLLIESVCSIRR